MRLVRALAGLLTVGLVAIGCAGSDDQAGEPVSAAPESGLLFVQSAEGASTADDNRFVMRGTSPITTVFASEPERFASSMPTTAFVDSFESRFPDGSPNATISSLEAGVGEFPVEISEPIYDPTDNSLSYRIAGLDPDVVLTSEMGKVSLFIDPDTVVPPVTISGSVADERGAPIGDATVTVTYEYKECGASTCHTATASAGSTTTASDGTFSTTGAYAWGTDYGMNAIADGYREETATVSIGESGATQDFTLSPDS